jgi:hypothetical protein
MIGAARNHPLELAALLGLPPLAYVVFGMVLGHPDDDPVPRGRMPLAGVLFFERYAETVLDAVIDSADHGMRLWAHAVNRRAAPGARTVHEGRGWSDRMAALWSKARTGSSPRAALRERLRALGFALE